MSIAIKELLNTVEYSNYMVLKPLYPKSQYDTSSLVLFILLVAGNILNCLLDNRFNANYVKRKSVNFTFLKV